MSGKSTGIGICSEQYIGEQVLRTGSALAGILAIVVRVNRVAGKKTQSIWMRSFVLTPRLKAAFAAVNSHGKLDESEKQKFEVYAAAELREDCPEDPVPLSVVQRLSEILRSDSHRGLITGEPTG
jgi:hypothetical protein